MEKPIDGITITRTPIFSSLVSDYDWPRKMVVAMEAARSLGVPRFEIDITGDQRDVPITQAVGVDYMGVPHYKTVGSKPEPTQRVTVFALRVEDA